MANKSVITGSMNRIAKDLATDEVGTMVNTPVTNMLTVSIFGGCYIEPFNS